MMIDSKVQVQLRAKFNPEGSELRKLQLRMLDMLKYIDKVCKENNIKYWLSSGTCLGAVRHGGFIPWDDDCDIEMLEEDYKKFLKLMYSDINCPYIFQTARNDHNFNYTFGKVRDLNSILYETHEADKFYKYRGVFIDVFCMIRCNSLFLFKCGNYLKNKEFKYKLLSLTTNKIYNKIKSHFYAIINTFTIPLCKCILKIGPKNELRHNLGTAFLAPRNFNEIFPLFEMRFEDSFFPVPGNYDSYLKRLFGDYNKLPNLENMKSHINKFDLR